MRDKIEEYIDYLYNVNDTISNAIHKLKSALPDIGEKIGGRLK